MHKTLLAGAAVAALGLAPAAAQADSLSFTKDDNVFVSAPDGSNLTQVTTDGEAGYGAYRSPTQADDGTVVAGRGDYIVYRSHKNDDLGKSDPPSTKDSRDVTADGMVHDVAIAPNGDKVAYSFVTLSAAPYTPGGARVVTGYLRTADDNSDYGTSYNGMPSWVTNDRVLTFGGFQSQVNLQDVAPGTSDQHWFDEEDGDVEAGAATRQGDRIAILRSDGSDRSYRIYRVDGSIQAGGVPPKPSAVVCDGGTPVEAARPSFSPDGSKLVYEAEDGVHVMNADCSGDALVAAGAKEPHWGAADVGAIPDLLKDQPGQPDQGGTAGLKLGAFGKVKLRKAIKGLKLKLTAPGAGKVAVAATLTKAQAKKLKLGRKVASGKATATKAGRVAVKLRFTKPAARKLKRLKKVKLAVTATYTPTAGGAPAAATRKLMLKR